MYHSSGGWTSEIKAATDSTSIEGHFGLKNLPLTVFSYGGHTLYFLETSFIRIISLLLRALLL